MKSNVDSDPDDTWVVPGWLTSKVDVSGFADKGPVSLRLFCTDKGTPPVNRILISRSRISTPCIQTEIVGHPCRWTATWPACLANVAHCAPHDRRK